MGRFLHNLDNKKTWRRGMRNKNKSHICTQNSDKMESRTAENPGKCWGKEETCK